MRLFSSIASEVAFVVAFVVILTLLPLVLTRLSYRVFPWSIEALLTRAFVWTCAWAMEGASWLLSLLERAVFALAWRRQSHRLHRLTQRVSAMREAVSPERLHVTAKALHRVCWPCYEGAAGWWDHDIDCGGHDCRECADCRDRAQARADMRGGRHSTRA